MQAAPIRTAPPTEAWIRRHQRGVWRFLRWLGCDAALADDLTQEAFVRLLTTQPRFDGEERAAAWLRATAHNLFRSSRRRARTGVPLDDEAALAAIWRRCAPDDSGDRAIDALEHCLQALGPTARNAIELHYRHRVAQRQLAKLLGLRLGGVKSLLQRARNALAICIEHRQGNAS